VPLVIQLVRVVRRPTVIVAECVMCGHEYEIDRASLREAVA
jgi:Zn ribbon nucleic-acid-binding protein